MPGSLKVELAKHTFGMTLKLLQIPGLVAFPPESIDQVIHICLQKVLHRL